MSDDAKWIGAFMGSEIDKLRAELAAAQKLCGEAAATIAKAREWQAYAERMEREADAAMAGEIQEMRQKNTALRADLAARDARLSDIASAAREGMQQGDNGGSPSAALEYIYQTARIDALAKAEGNGE